MLSAMKVKMLQTLKLLGTWPEWTFHKGRTYNAVPATNQPRHVERGLLFVEKGNGQSMLVSLADKEVVAV